MKQFLFTEISNKETELIANKQITIAYDVKLYNRLFTKEILMKKTNKVLKITSYPINYRHRNLFPFVLHLHLRRYIP